MRGWMLEMMMVNNNKQVGVNASCLPNLDTRSQPTGRWQFSTIAGERTILHNDLLRLACVGKFRRRADDLTFDDSNIVSKSHFEINQPSYRSIPLWGIPRTEQAGNSTNFLFRNRQRRQSLLRVFFTSIKIRSVTRDTSL